MIRKIVLSLILMGTVFFSGFFPADALAGNANPDIPAGKIEEAADKIDRPEEKQGAKDVYFKGSEGGSEIIDKARETAKDKLKDMAVKAKNEPDRELPESQKGFLRKFYGRGDK